MFRLLRHIFRDDDADDIPSPDTASGRIKLWAYILALLLFVAGLAFPDLAQEWRDLRGDRRPGRSHLFSGILKNQEPAFLAVERYLQDDALSRVPDPSDFSEWYYPVTSTTYTNHPQITGLTRFDGSTVHTDSVLADLEAIWSNYGKFTSICIMPDRTIFSFDSGTNNLVHLQISKKPTYLLYPDEPIEFYATRISDFWYRMRAEAIRA